VQGAIIGQINIIGEINDETYFNVDSSEDFTKHNRRIFIKGYTQCQEDMADRKYTEQDIISIVKKSRETGLTAEYLILQLNKQD